MIYHNPDIIQLRVPKEYLIQSHFCNNGSTLILDICSKIELLLDDSIIRFGSFEILINQRQGDIKIDG